MLYVEAPSTFTRDMPGKLFSGGGITGCANWQKPFYRSLDRRFRSGVFFNPRRAHYKYTPEDAHQQIAWEFEYMRLADAISFWFSPETLCPIALFELGKWIVSTKPVFVGVHPDYRRGLDVHEQCELQRPEIKIATSLEELANQVANWLHAVPTKA